MKHLVEAVTLSLSFRNAAEYCDGPHVFEPHSLGWVGSRRLEDARVPLKEPQTESTPSCDSELWCWKPLGLEDGTVSRPFLDLLLMLYKKCFTVGSLGSHIVKGILSGLDHLALFFVGLHSYFCSVYVHPGCQETANPKPEVMVSMVAFTRHILVLFSKSQTLSLTYFNVCILIIARVYTWTFWRQGLICRSSWSGIHGDPPAFVSEVLR